MRIPLFGTGVSSGQKQVTVRRAVNMLFELRGETEKSPLVAVPMPGTSMVASTGVNGYLRAIASSHQSNGMMYFVVDGKAYTFNPPSTIAEIGTVADTPTYTNCHIAVSDGSLVGFCSGGSLYSYNGSTWAAKTPGFIVGALLWMDGYFIAAERDTNRFHVSTDLDTWGDVASAESRGDSIVAMLARGSELVLVGTDTIEFWAHTGAPDFPFERVTGATISTGTAFSRSVCLVQGVPYLIVGKGAVTSVDPQATPPYIARITGYSLEPVSTPDIGRVITNWYPGGVVAFGFSLGGRPMYVASQTGDIGIIYDAATGLWSELSGDAIGRCRVAHESPLFGVVGSTSGVPVVLRKLDSGVHDYFERRIITDHVVSPDGERFTVDSLRLDMATNMDAAEKQVKLKVSRDGGLSWGAEQSVGLGTTTGPQKKVEFRRLGRSRSFTFDLSFPTDVPLTVHSASINASD